MVSLSQQEQAGARLEELMRQLDMSSDEETEIKARAGAPKHPGTREGHGPHKAQHYAWTVGEGFEETVYGAR